MGHQVFSEELVASVVKELQIADLAHATIGEVLLVASRLEQQTGIPFIRMDQGSPGLPANRVGVEAEKAALDRGVGAQYPAADGIPELKREASRFVKAFVDIDIPPRACIPTTGSVAASFGAFVITTQCVPGKDKVLFIDPGFPIQKSQLRIIGAKWEQFDIYHYRGEALREKLESYLKQGDIAAIVYSNPNNPAWICLEDSELAIIGELSTRYGVIVLEDMAYFCMDSHYPALAERYGDSGVFGQTFVASVLYMITSGCTASTQYGYAEMLRAATDGELDFAADVREYARRAERMKKIFTDNGFHIVYDYDVTRPVGDGFFFTVGYGRMSGGELLRELLYYGVSSISLETTGSGQPGVRACTSRMREELYPLMEERMKAFRLDHPLS